MNGCPTVLLAAFVSLPHAAAAAPAESAPAKKPAATRPAHEHGKAHDSHDAHDATVHHRFDDVDHWVKLFDDPARDAWQKPEELVKALGLAPGDRVADIGAGTGYFERWLARAVGLRGTVLAMDVETALVEHIRKRAEAEATANVIPILGSYDNPRLPAGAVNLVLIVDTYHHIDDRLHYFARLQEVLAGGGRVAIVDFQKRETPVGPPLEHKLARETVVEEMAQAGYKLDREIDILPYQYALVFRPGPPAAAPSPSPAP